MRQLLIVLMLSTPVLAACRNSPTPDVEATVQAEQPTATPAPGPTSTPGQPDTRTPLPPTNTPAPVPTATSIPPTSTSAPSDLSATPPISATSSALVATEDEVLRVRSGPGTDYGILGRLQPGTELALLARSSDGSWFQIAYPADSDERGWVAGEFLEIQGSPDGLPVAQASPTTPSSTVQAVDACAPISDQDYGALPIASAPTDRPAASHPDLNLDLRDYAPANVPSALIDLAGATDPAAPELRELFGDKREPAIVGAYQVYDWDWNADARGPLIGDPEVTLLGLKTTPGEIIDAPDGGSDLGEGYVALVLYAAPERITLKYTREDNVVHGYTLHIENLCVEPTLLALYQQMNDDGRSALPAVRPGEPLGRATGPEIGIVVRDKGSFLDPRSRKDWWSGG